MQYMKDHALICKFIGFYLDKRALQRWISHKWKPNEEVDLKLSLKGLFMTIFFNQEERERIIEQGLYFFNNADFFVRHNKQKFSQEWEDISEVIL